MKKSNFLKITLLLLTSLLFLFLLGCEVTINTTAENGCLFSIVYDNEIGNAYSMSKDGYYPSGTEITAHAAGSENYDFMCWSIGGYLEDGGTDISHEKDYTFTLTDDLYLYANYKDSKTAIVRYHMNGGYVVETGADTYDQTFSLEYYLYPNSMPSMGYFARDGYTLIDYNTEPDGSGTAINVGGKVLIETDCIIDLYCIWSKQTDVSLFDYSMDESLGGYVITGYHGNETEISIPKEINGTTVVGIAQGALCGAGMETLVLPETLKRVEIGACNDCTNLKNLYLFDSLEYIQDDSFSNSTPSQYVFGAATNPRFSKYFNNHSKKIEVLAKSYYTSDKPRMIFVGGSSITYAVDNDLMTELLNDEYDVINFGTNGANLWSMTSVWVMKYVKEGDLVVQLPEYGLWQFGSLAVQWESFRSFEGCYNVYRWVDGTYFVDFLNAYCEFLDARSQVEEVTYEDYVSTLAPTGYYDDHGMLKVQVHGNTSDFHSGRSITLFKNYFYDYMILSSNYAYQAFKEMGVDIVMAWPPLNYNALTNDPSDPAIDEFVTYVDETLDVEIISDIHEYFYTGDNFFDDDYHLCYDSRLIYTRQLANDILNYLNTQDAE